MPSINNVWTPAGEYGEVQEHWCSLRVMGWRSYCVLSIVLLVEQLVVVKPFSMFPAFIISEQYSLSLLVNQFNSLCILHAICLSCS